MMTVDKALEIAEFLKCNEIQSLNMMGGEFFCNPDWHFIIDQFLALGGVVRLVSNADWFNNDEVKGGLIDLNQRYSGHFFLSLSRDKWHTNIGVDAAAAFLKCEKIPYVVESEEESSDNSLIPIGRSECSFGIFGMLACYCHNPAHQYSFLIDEAGEIYKCPFGVWDYANTSEYVSGGFHAKFKEFNKKFYDIFIPSCTSCIRMARNRKSC